MLNEIQEYAEYTSDVSELSTFRLIPELFTEEKKLRGIIRAMTVVARAELEREGYFDTALDTAAQRKIIEKVKEALRRWSGFDTTDSEHGWLECYYNNYYNKIRKQSIEKPSWLKDGEMPTWEEVVKKTSKQYNTAIVESLDKDWRAKSDTMLAGSYEKIIASAVYLGPLKRYYLVCKKGAEEALEHNGNRLSLSGENKKNSEKADNALRLIAAYLLKQRLTGAQANQVNMTDLGYWAQNKNICESKYYITKKKGKEYEINYKGNQLFFRDTVKKNITKIVMNSQYMKDFDFKLVEESEFDSIEEGYTYFSDLGAGHALQQDKEYEPLEKVDLFVM